jgi:hypothetical protein
VTDKWEGYIPTPKRRKLGLHVPPNLKIRGDLASRIDSSGGGGVCWPWLGPTDRYGYGQTTGANRAHRIVWQEFNGRRLTRDEVVRHTCDNPICCNPAHLVLGTHADNVRDRVERDRSAKGVMNGRAKLEAATVLAIYSSPKRPCDLAREHDLHESTVRGIKTGKTWGWLTASYSKERSLESKKERGHAL